MESAKNEMAKVGNPVLMPLLSKTVATQPKKLSINTVCITPAPFLSSKMVHKVNEQMSIMGNIAI